MAWGFDQSQDAYNQVYQDGGGYDQPEKHEAKFSHEMIGGAAAFAGFKAYEDHQRKEGNQVNHAFAKELLVGFVGGEVDKLAETKGEDFVDRERAHHHAKQSAEKMYDDHYGNADNYDPSSCDQPQQFNDY